VIFYIKSYAKYFPFYKNSIIIDVGAHKGFFSLFASKNLKDNAVIYSIEPSSSNYNQLLRNIELNEIKNIKSFNIALNGKGGENKLYLSLDENNSLIINEKDDISKNYEVVNCETLDSFIDINHIELVDFLKLDCEGSEYEILFNASKATFNKIKTISLEFHDLKDESKTPQELISFLETHNYILRNFKYDPTDSNVNSGRIVMSK
jgi:FkbM family methyltransferase